MSIFNVELRKVIDDINAGLVGNVKKYVVVTDSNVKPLYVDRLLELLKSNGYEADLIVFPAREENKTRKTKEYVEDRKK